MPDLQNRVFENTAFGKAAIQKIGNCSKDFRIFEAEIVDNYGTVRVKGAEFRAPKIGPNKGTLSVVVPGTVITVYVTRDESSRFDDTHHPEN